MNDAVDVHIAQHRRRVAGTVIELCTVHRRGHRLRVVAPAQVVTGMS